MAIAGIKFLNGTNMFLLVTEKCGPQESQRDGGARLVASLQRALGSNLKIMQFGPQADPSSTWHFKYPYHHANRFERRLANAEFILTQVKAVENLFTHVVFSHVSMQFGLTKIPLHEDITIWTFPMFMTPSYQASGELVPNSYFQREYATLALSKNILTPSHLEKQQLIDDYSIPEEHIHVVPRGVDTRILSPKVRSLNGPPKFCSIGSIKPQKNTVGLVQLFAKIRSKFPDSTLQMIGPVQDDLYATLVKTHIKQLDLEHHVEWTGYIPPERLAGVIEDAHLHLSTSTCETFGRSIFETLASGLPNIARATGNAAKAFLEHLPYARFIDDLDAALIAIEELLDNLPLLSSLALEIGELYEDEKLSQWLAAKILGRESIAISDFDGTLFHKNDPEKTQRSLEAFRNFPVKIICSARPVEDLLQHLAFHQLKVDWIVACSGSIVTDGSGKPLWLTPLDPEAITRLETLLPQSKKISFGGQTLQIAVPATEMPELQGLRSEVYQGTAFIAHWRASKLHAVHRLLRTINWSGQMRVFGDGPYDHELLTYFDGTLITSQKEIVYV